MGTVILICGKICSGKSWYAKQLKAQNGGVILSTDEVTYDLTNNQQGDGYDAFAARVNRYLQKKAGEIALAGCDVILDWGFWTKEDRMDITSYFQKLGIPVRWHYVDVSQEIWDKNIEARNARILAGQGGSDFYVDEGLLKKLEHLFQVPRREEMDIWYVPQWQ